jgi:hypothetical protein
MISPSRGPERLVRAGQWLVALLFAYFLIQVGGAVIADLPLLSKPPTLEQFLDRAAVNGLENDLRPLESRRQALADQLQAVEQRQADGREAYDRDKAAFETWRATRSATAQSAQNPEVISRARQLDLQLERQRQRSEERQQLQQGLAGVEAAIAPKQRRLDGLRSQAEGRLAGARQRTELRVFAIRLLFVGPLLALALWQFRRFRRGEQWPFVWGFLLFALFAFFVELVPYLPPFGAYIRYGVGALLTVVVGRALIAWLKAYGQRLQREQAAPAEQRQRSIRYEKALQAISRNQCPGCDRSLPRHEGALPDYCMHCGLQLQYDCPSCSHHTLTFFPYCPSCGAAAGSAAGSAAGGPAADGAVSDGAVAAS